MVMPMRPNYQGLDRDQLAEIITRDQPYPVSPLPQPGVTTNVTSLVRRAVRPVQSGPTPGRVAAEDFAVLNEIVGATTPGGDDGGTGGEPIAAVEDQPRRSVRRTRQVVPGGRPAADLQGRRDERGRLSATRYTDPPLPGESACRPGTFAVGPAGSSAGADLSRWRLAAIRARLEAD